MPLGRPPRPVLDRIAERTADWGVEGACWPCTLSPDSDGYSQVRLVLDGVRRTRRTHRVVYTLLVAPIDDGLQLDHLCRNPPCVNPAHLEPVTPKVNTHRGEGPSGRNARKTHCHRGHEFTPRNTLRKSNGHGGFGRACRQCEIEWKRAHYSSAKRRAQYEALQRKRAVISDA